MLRMEDSGVESLESSEAAAVQGGEYPFLSPEVLRAMRDTARTAAVWVATKFYSLCCP